LHSFCFARKKLLRGKSVTATLLKFEQKYSRHFVASLLNRG
jgi:hypothetical protein